MTAEYANYRKRTERDRETEAVRSRADVLGKILPILDDLDLAESHGDLAEGPLALIAQKLRGTLQGMGLEQVGEVGEVFDPQFHDAIAQLPTPGATEMTIADVVSVGYRLGDVLIRPAKVAVAVPAA